MCIYRGVLGEPELSFVIVLVRMYTVESMGLYRLPTGMGSYDVGISYHNTDFKELALSLHDNNEKKSLFQNQSALKQRGKVSL